MDLYRGSINFFSILVHRIVLDAEEILTASGAMESDSSSTSPELIERIEKLENKTGNVKKLFVAQEISFFFGFWCNCVLLITSTDDIFSGSQHRTIKEPTRAACTTSRPCQKNWRSWKENNGLVTTYYISSMILRTCNQSNLFCPFTFKNMICFLQMFSCLWWRQTRRWRGVWRHKSRGQWWFILHWSKDATIRFPDIFYICVVIRL